MNTRVLVPLAEGFEEIEAVTVIDVLRRAGVEVLVASVGNARVVAGARAVKIEADCLLAECVQSAFEMIVLPGGIPGATNLAASVVLQDMLKAHVASGRLVAAICASPAVVLQPLGLLGHECVACYPTFREKLDVQNRCEDRVRESAALITGAGPGASMEFALALVRRLKGQEKMDALASAMLAN